MQLSTIRVFLGAVLSVLAATSSVARADPAAREPVAFKPPAPGTTFIWKKVGTDKTGEQVFGRAEGLKVFYSWDGKDRSAYIACKYCGGSMSVDVEAYSTLWPLTVGKTVTVNRSNYNGSWVNTITVAGLERLTLPLGEVSAVHIVNRSNALTGNWEGVFDYWYAPDLGYIVRTKNSDSSYGESVWEVTEVKQP